MEIPFVSCDTTAMNGKLIGKRIKRYRVGARLTQEQLSAKLGMTGKSVSNWETGKEKPSSSAARLLADFFGVDSSEFIDNDEREALRTAVEQKVTEQTGAELDDRERQAIAIIARLRADPDRFDIWLRDGETLIGGRI